MLHNAAFAQTDRVGFEQTRHSVHDGLAAGAVHNADGLAPQATSVHGIRSSGGVLGAGQGDTFVGQACDHAVQGIGFTPEPGTSVQGADGEGELLGAHHRHNTAFTVHDAQINAAVLPPPGDITQSETCPEHMAESSSAAPLLQPTLPPPPAPPPLTWHIASLAEREAVIEVEAGGEVVVNLTHLESGEVRCESGVPPRVRLTQLEAGAWYEVQVVRNGDAPEGTTPTQPRVFATPPHISAAQYDIQVLPMAGPSSRLSFAFPTPSMQYGNFTAEFRSVISLESSANRKPRRFVQDAKRRVVTQIENGVRHRLVLTLQMSVKDVPCFSVGYAAVVVPETHSVGEPKVETKEISWRTTADCTEATVITLYAKKAASQNITLAGPVCTLARPAASLSHAFLERVLANPKLLLNLISLLTVKAGGDPQSAVPLQFYVLGALGECDVDVLRHFVSVRTTLTGGAVQYALHLAPAAKVVTEVDGGQAEVSLKAVCEYRGATVASSSTEVLKVLNTIDSDPNPTAVQCWLQASTSLTLNKTTNSRPVTLHLVGQVEIGAVMETGFTLLWVSTFPAFVVVVKNCSGEVLDTQTSERDPTDASTLLHNACFTGFPSATLLYFEIKGEGGAGHDICIHSVSGGVQTLPPPPDRKHALRLSDHLLIKHSNPAHKAFSLHISYNTEDLLLPFGEEVHLSYGTGNAALSYHLTTEDRTVLNPVVVSEATVVEVDPHRVFPLQDLEYNVADNTVSWCAPAGAASFTLTAVLFADEGGGGVLRRAFAYNHIKRRSFVLSDVAEFSRGRVPQTAAHCIEITVSSTDCGDQELVGVICAPGPPPSTSSLFDLNSTTFTLHQSEDQFRNAFAPNPHYAAIATTQLRAFKSYNHFEKCCTHSVPFDLQRYKGLPFAKKAVVLYSPASLPLFVTTVSTISVAEDLAARRVGVEVTLWAEETTVCLEEFLNSVAVQCEGVSCTESLRMVRGACGSVVLSFATSTVIRDATNGRAERIIPPGSLLTFSMTSPHILPSPLHFSILTQPLLSTPTLEYSKSGVNIAFLTNDSVLPSKILRRGENGAVANSFAQNDNVAFGRKDLEYTRVAEYGGGEEVVNPLCFSAVVGVEVKGFSVIDVRSCIVNSEDATATLQWCDAACKVYHVRLEDPLRGTSTIFDTMSPSLLLRSLHPATLYLICISSPDFAEDNIFASHFAASTAFLSAPRVDTPLGALLTEQRSFKNSVLPQIFARAEGRGDITDKNCKICDRSYFFIKDGVLRGNIEHIEREKKGEGEIAHPLRTERSAFSVNESHTARIELEKTLTVSVRTEAGEELTLSTLGQNSDAEERCFPLDHTELVEQMGGPVQPWYYFKVILDAKVEVFERFSDGKGQIESDVISVIHPTVSSSVVFAVPMSKRVCLVDKVSAFSTALTLDMTFSTEGQNNVFSVCTSAEGEKDMSKIFQNTRTVSHTIPNLAHSTTYYTRIVQEEVDPPEGLSRIASQFFFTSILLGRHVSTTFFAMTAPEGVTPIPLEPLLVREPQILKIVHAERLFSSARALHEAREGGVPAAGVSYLAFRVLPDNVFYSQVQGEVVGELCYLGRAATMRAFRFVESDVGEAVLVLDIDEMQSNTPQIIQVLNITESPHCLNSITLSTPLEVELPKIRLFGSFSAQHLNKKTQFKTVLHWESSICGEEEAGVYPPVQKEFLYRCKVVLYAFTQDVYGRREGEEEVAPVNVMDFFNRTVLDVGVERRMSATLERPFHGTVYSGRITSDSCTATPLDFCFLTPPLPAVPLNTSLLDYVFSFELPKPSFQFIPNSDIILFLGVEITICDEVANFSRTFCAKQIFFEESEEREDTTLLHTKSFERTPSYTKIALFLTSHRRYTVTRRSILQAEEKRDNAKLQKRAPLQNFFVQDFDVESAYGRVPTFISYANLTDPRCVSPSVVTSFHTEQVLPTNLAIIPERCVAPKDGRGWELWVAWDVAHPELASLIFQVQRVEVPAALLQNTPSGSVLELWEENRGLVEGQLEEFWDAVGVETKEVGGGSECVFAVQSAELCVYRVRSKCTSRSEYSPWCATTPLRCPVRHPAVAGLQVTSVSPTSASIAWTPSRAYGQPAPLSFDVSWRAATSPVWEHVTVSTPQHSFALKRLIPKTQYKVRVTPLGNARNAAESASRILSVRTREDMKGCRALQL